MTQYTPYRSMLYIIYICDSFIRLDKLYTIMNDVFTRPARYTLELSVTHDCALPHLNSARLSTNHVVHRNIYLITYTLFIVLLLLCRVPSVLCNRISTPQYSYYVLPCASHCSYCTSSTYSNVRYYRGVYIVYLHI